MSAHQPLRLSAFSEEMIAPFGAIIRPPETAGERQFYSRWLTESHPGTTIRMHVNKVPATALPYRVEQLERHPRTAQIFVPLDVERYVVLVARAAPDGTPDIAHALAMIVPGDRGIVFAAGAWHAGAVVLDRAGSFCVLAYRDDTPADDEFVTLPRPLDVQL